MRTCLACMVTLSIGIFLTSCVLRRPQVWEAYERSGLGKVDTRLENKPPSSNMIERLISVPLDPQNPSGEKFDLYYFVRMPAKGRASRSILYCAGGPGQIVPGPVSGMTFADFLTANGYNVVYFHQRGAGLSQIPASNQYDRFLKTSYAVADLEAIRRDFLGKDAKWDAIIGWSYGTVVAQQYAHFHRDNVDRLILIGPMSRHKFKNSEDAFHEMLKEIRNTDRRTLARIYLLDQFADLSVNQRDLILDNVFGSIKMHGIFDRAEEAFGNLNFLIDSYCDLKERKELEAYSLDKYSREFFQALRDLRMFGWRPQDPLETDQQVRIGHRVKEEILYSHQVIDDCFGQKKNNLNGESQRAFYVINTYDGINMRFLKEWLGSGKQNVLNALRKSGGEANELRNVNEYIKKIGINNSETIEPWDPAQYRHNRPTLILIGNADTVPAGDTTAHIFRNALTGARTLIEFPGSGHTLLLPNIPLRENIFGGIVRTDALAIPPGETRRVLGTYRGRRLNENFRMELKTDALQPDLKLSGFGIVRKNENGTLDVVLSLENTGGEPMMVPRKWTLGNKLFQSTLSLDSQTINPGTKKEVLGRIEAAWRNQEGVIRLEKPPDLETSLEPLCSQVRTEGSQIFEIWIRNNSNKSVDGIAKSWTLSKNKFSSTFSVDPESIASEEVLNIQRVVTTPFLTDLNLETNQNIRLPENELIACIQEEREDKLSVVIYNGSTNLDFPGGKQITLNIENSVFSRTYHLDLPPLKPHAATIVQLTNPRYDWNDPPVIAASSSVGSGLRMLGWNVTSDFEISLLLRNDSQNQIEVPTEWFYIDPAEDDEDHLACTREKSSYNSRLDCLIYSFLVMSSELFSSVEDNKVLGSIIDDGANVCYRDENGRRSRKQTGDNCTFHERN